MGYENDLANLGLLSGGAQGFIKGIQDAEDHTMRLEDQKMRKMELDAKLRSQDQEREQQRTIRAREEAIRARTSGFKAPDGMSLQEATPDQWVNDPDWEARQTRIAAAHAAAVDAAKPPTTDQFNAAGYVKRMEDADANFKALMARGFDPSSFKAQAESAFPGFAEGLKSEEQKLYENNVRNFGSAILRKQSGAAISASEFADTAKNYFPQAGDTPEVIAQKEQNRAQAIAALRAEGGKAYKKIAPVAKPKGKLKTGLVNEGRVAAPAQAKPKTVIQNGVTYTLNPQTGEYE